MESSLATRSRSLRMGFRVARRLRFARTAPRATLGAFPEGVGSAKDVPPGAMGSRTGEAAPPFLRKLCVRASRNDIQLVVCASRMARFLSRDGAPETDAHPLSDAGTTWWTTRLATTSCRGPRGARSSRFTRRTSSPASCCRSTSSTETSARSCGNSTPTWVHSRFYPRTRVPERPGGRARASLDAHAPGLDS